MRSMYGSVLFLGIQNVGSVQPIVAVERIVFYRERVAGMYSALPYVVAYVIRFSYMLELNIKVLVCFWVEYN